MISSNSTAFVRATLIGLLGIVLVGCSAGESKVASGNRNGVLYFGNGTEPQTIDPHVLSGAPEANVAGALFEPLVRVNPYTEQIEAGVAFVNHIAWTYASMPMGGVKKSGYGRELGHLGILEFVNQKLIRVFE